MCGSTPRIGEHQKRFGDGSVVLGLGGRHLHWSCMRKVNPRSLSMADSGTENIVRSDRRYCTTGLASYDRPHILEEAFLLELR